MAADDTRSRPSSRRRWIAGPPGTPELAAFAVVLAVTLALTAGYLIETPVIPLLYLLRNPGSALVVVGLREESFKLLNSPFVYSTTSPGTWSTRF